MWLLDVFLIFLPDLLKSSFRLIPNAISKFKLKRFFGKSVIGKGNFWLALDPYYHPLPRSGNRFIKRFLGRKPDQPLIGEDRILGSNILRLIGYISSALGKYRDNNFPINFVADEDIQNRWDGTIVSFGSSDSNLKTYDIERLPENSFYTFGRDENGQRCFIIQEQRYCIAHRDDKAIILRLKNPRSPEHWLFICAGLGEWGTSGSARYLFTHWKQLYKRFKKKNFVMVLSIRERSDENVVELYVNSN